MMEYTLTSSTLQLYIPSSSMIKGTSLNFSLYNATQGNVSWFVSCTDNSSLHLMGNSTTRLIALDYVSPSITVSSPPNNTLSNSNTVSFVFSATDNNDVTNCTLSVNDTLVSANLSVIDGQQQNVTTFLSGGNHTWLINCSDQANNYAISGPYMLMVLDADYYVKASDINFSIG